MRFSLHFSYAYLCKMKVHRPCNQKRILSGKKKEKQLRTVPPTGDDDSASLLLRLFFEGGPCDQPSLLPSLLSAAIERAPLPRPQKHHAYITHTRFHNPYRKRGAEVKIMATARHCRPECPPIFFRTSRIYIHSIYCACNESFHTWQRPLAGWGTTVNIHF